MDNQKVAPQDHYLPTFYLHAALCMQGSCFLSLDFQQLYRVYSFLIDYSLISLKISLVVWQLLGVSKHCEGTVFCCQSFGFGGQEL